MIRKPKGLGEYAAMLGIWVGLMLLFGVLSQNFLTARTLGTVANRIPTLAVVAAGMTLVLIIGGIDLSVGSVLGLAGSVLGVAMVNWQWPMADHMGWQSPASAAPPGILVPS